MNSDVLVEVKNVSKKFSKDLKKSLWYGLLDITSTLFGKVKTKSLLREKEFWAVRDVSFSLKRGECLGLIGHNGAGKSTLLKMLNGLIKPDEGEIILRGRVGALIELGAGFNPILSGRENIYINGQLLGFTKKEIDNKLQTIIDFSELGDFIDAPVQNYSSGMRVRLGFAVAAQMEPDVLLLDEVLAVGDLGFRIKCLNRISEIMANACVIFVSHSMPQVARVCTGGILMDKGGVLAHSTNVGEIINAYYSRFNRENKAVFSSGKVDIINLSVKGTDNDEGKVLFGRSLHLNLKIRVVKQVKKFTVKFMIINAEMRNVVDIPSQLYNDSFQNTGEVTELSLSIPSVNLNLGVYGVGVVLHDADSGERMLRADNIVSFQVEGEYLSWCDYVINTDWKIESQNLNRDLINEKNISAGV